MNRIRISTILLAAALAMVIPAPLAAAHTCAAYDGCDAGSCVDGQNHSHTDYNYQPFRDEHCSSSANPSQPTGCSMLGIDDWPKKICDLVDEHFQVH